MAKPATEHWSVPIPSDFAEELESVMREEGFNSKAEFTRAALREKLERCARRRLDARLLEAMESPVSSKSNKEFFAELREKLKRDGRRKGGA